MAQKFFLVVFEADEIGERETFSALMDRSDNGDAEIDIQRIRLDHVSARQIEKACAQG
jgi:hypothetical protein